MSIAEAFTGLLPDFLTEADRADIEDVLAAAAEWAAGRMPIEAFARVGTIPTGAAQRPSAAFTRYCATVLGTGDPRHGALLRAIDELISFQGFRCTDHGVFSGDDLAGVTIHYRRKDAAA